MKKLIIASMFLAPLAAACGGGGASAYADEMCKCKDTDCTLKVAEKYKDAQPSIDEAKKIGECMKNMALGGK